MADESKAKPIDFESSLSELETLVSKMEAGNLTLEESLAAFETGIKLTRECQAELSRAEQRVKKLVEEDGRLESLDFEETDDES